ncbi:hypothetical protein [Agreia sp. PsM10]|uniref:hypothetical protein n=1 Tax=Agreia sp. PsM10 TaxID=3030533 RepID=UPI00263BD22A|nr:hypothetical protein [Agreia sp. PsM10]
MAHSGLTAGEVNDLAAITWTLIDGWHEWAGPDPDTDVLDAFFTAHVGFRELFEKSFADAQKYPKYESSITVGDGPAEAVDLSLSVGRLFLTQPLTLLVENMLNDGLFYRRGIAALSPDLVRTFDSASPPIVFSNGGGIEEVSKIVRSRRAKSLQTGVPDRLIVLVDGDSKYPSHVPTSVSDVRKECSAHGASAIVLEKRSIENYLSDRHLDEYLATFQSEDLERNVNFVKGMSQVQRDHFPMKNGFKHLPVGHEAAIYVGLSQDDLEHRKLGRAMAYFLDHPSGEFTLEDLRSVDAVHEFESIVDQIRKAS